MNEREDGFYFDKWSSKGNESVSGPGSTLEATVALRFFLQGLFQQYKIKTFVDAPCGDFNWMKEVDLTGITYHGLDIVDDIIEHNKEKYTADNLNFQVADICTDPLPRGDMFMCRECLFHLRYQDILLFWKNFLASENELLFVTSEDVRSNSDMPKPGGFENRNFDRRPFRLPRPLVQVPDWRHESPYGRKRSRFMNLYNREHIQIGVERLERYLRRNQTDEIDASEIES